MTDGYWINYRSGKIVPIHDHEKWIRDEKNARKIGVSSNVHTLASKIKDREKYLLFLLQNAPLIRVRGHGAFVTFETNSRERQDVIDAIWIWGKRNAGPFTWMDITNFATRENTQITFAEFEKVMNTGGPEAVLRIAGATNKISVSMKISKELLKLSKQILTS